MSLAQQILLGNYLVIAWILFVWAYTGGFVKIKPVLDNTGSNIYKWNYSKAMLWVIAIPIIVWAGTRGNVEDTGNYRWNFFAQDTGFSAIIDAILGEEKGKGFQVLSILIKTIVGNRHVLFFLIIATIVMVYIMNVYREYSCMLPMSIFLFVVSVDCYQWMFNGMRQFIAVAIVFYAMKKLLQKRTFLFIILVLIASTIHSVALVALIALYFVNKKPWSSGVMIFVFGFLCVLFFLGSFTQTMDILLAETNYSHVVSQFSNDDGVSVLRVFVYSVPTILALFCRKSIERLEDQVINFAINMSLVSTCLYILGMFTSGIFMGRIPIFFSLWNYVLLPWEIKTLFNAKSRQIIILAMLIAYMVFNYYQMSVYMAYYW